MGAVSGVVLVWRRTGIPRAEMESMKPVEGLLEWGWDCVESEGERERENAMV